MIVRRLKDIIDTSRDVKAKTWASRRLLLREDGMGFSMHHTVIYAGTQTHIWYQHHLEGVYCVEGVGSVELIPSGETFRIEPGTLYALNKHDQHWLRAETDLHLICTFNPPLVGDETHDENGVYQLIPEQLVQDQPIHASLPASVSPPAANTPTAAVAVKPNAANAATTES